MRVLRLSVAIQWEGSVGQNVFKLSSTEQYPPENQAVPVFLLRESFVI